MIKKLKARSIFNGTEMLPANYVLEIGADGSIIACRPEEPGEAGIEFLDGILCPGFINCHCHIELSHLKNKIEKHTGLVNFVQQVMQQRNEEPYLKEEAMKLALEELESGGTVAIGDICNSTDSLLLKKEGTMHWQNFIEVSGFVPAGAKQRFDAGMQLLKKFYAAAALGQHSLTPHAPYSVSQQLFSLINAATPGEILSIHNQEAAAEDKFFKFKEGEFLDLYKNLNLDISYFKPTKKSSLQNWLPEFTQAQRIIAVHNSFINQEDLDFIKNNPAFAQLSFCICINANLYIENTLPPVEMLHKNLVHLVIGTDSYASNEALSVIEEINSLLKHFQQIELAEILKWATFNGAATLGLSNMLGSFDAGKKPGVVLLRSLQQEDRLFAAEKIS